jgi:hypothetical protein
MKLIYFNKSTNPTKRFMIKFSNPRKTIHFGDINGSTYIDHHDKDKRDNYIARHEVREDWNNINAGSLSRYLLWGDSKDLKTNLIKYLNKFNIDHDIME